MSNNVTRQDSIINDRFSNGCAYIAEKYLPIEEAAIPITDWGFLRGDCVYDAIPFSDGRMFRLSDHIDRFWESMSKWRLTCPLDKTSVRDICHQCISRSGLRDGLLLIITTRGVPPSLEIRNPALFNNRFYAFAQVLPPIAAPENMQQGLKVIISKTPRVPEESIDSTAKNFQWGDLMQARLEAHDAGVDNAILLSASGELTEGPGFNVFTIHGENLSTPNRHCLKGITRETVLDIAEELGLQVHERSVNTEELFGADEVMFSTSAGGVMPVCEIDGKRIGSGERGIWTERITEIYWKRRASSEYTEEVAY